MRQLFRRLFRGIVAVGVIGVLLSGCSAAGSKAPTSGGGVLRLALIGAPATIDPLRVRDASGTEIDELVYDGLVRVSPKLLPEPDLAQSWHVSQDGETYTFHLNPHARWQDGKPVTPEDVVYSFAAYRNAANASPAAGLLSTVASVSAVGKDAVRIVLSRPYAPFLLQAATLPILPAHLLSGFAPGKALLGARALGSAAVGTGPFRISSIRGGQYVLTANRHYFLGAPHLRQITLTVESTPADALLALRHGRMDFAEVPPIDAHAVSTWPGVRMVRTAQLAFAGIVWNLSRSPWDSPSLRRALYFAVNRAKIVSGPLYGYASIANGPLPPASWAFDKSLSPRPYLPQRALQLLASAGYTARGGVVRSAKGVPLRLTILAPSGAPDRTAVLGLVVQDLQAIGIDAAMHYESFAQYTQDYVSGNFQAVFSLRGLSADPDVSAYFGAGAQGNVGGYRNGAVQSDLEAELSATTQVRRIADLQAMQSAMQVDPPELYLYFPQTVYALSRRFGGFTGNPAVVFYAPESWSDKSAR